VDSSIGFGDCVKAGYLDSELTIVWSHSATRAGMLLAESLTLQM
jgi:hypothetical protein